MADELSDRAKVRKDLLWGMYTDLRTHARHAETLRANVVNFMLLIASALIAVITKDGKVSRSDLPLCLALVVVGILGLAFAASYTELFERNRRRAAMLRTALDDEFLADGITIAALLREADEQHHSNRLYRWSRRVTGSTQIFWPALAALVTISGLVLTAIAL
ncbi:MAG TPA: hypothetical protein VGM10_10535 [Actinocrinis sp.]